ncbi:hypothetical protein [Marinomonas posidonica]|uniref:Uncharacterized protein n=1 Tax=Marinomonas posidonica (strain CECT 7376 / NCIMB 14433 / IVIA-Po-181) TaxID=491952 RepID=F6CUQ6_MARPP|nr:hypothetical protein [Marinomonas posidonica]AEF54166.1 hypothetical protein Mar181_1118 [Marinomonas posidonica IVIA-Po-181]
MKKLRQIRPLSVHQGGWVLLEVTLCLIVIGVILWSIMRQSDAQWYSLSLSEAQIKAEQNRQKAERMTHLFGQDVAFLVDDVESADHSFDYPDCLVCTQQNLYQWFKASLNPVSPLMVSQE